MSNKSNQKSSKKNAKSFFAEMNMMSVSATIGLVVLVIICFSLYGLMSSSPKKIVKIIDDADIFTAEQIEELEDEAKALSKKKDINVILVTTRDKGDKYSNSDEDCKRYAGNVYKDKAIKTSLVNNSGILMLVDLTEDEPGRRFFWLYTYGTAYFAVSDDDCNDLFKSHKKELSNQEYFNVYKDLLDELDEFNYSSMTPVTIICLIIPAIITALISLYATAGASLDPKPASKQYKSAECTMRVENILTKSEKKYTPSSSGGSGISGGGGGFSGGGGGHSGGGGGRF